MRNQKVVVNCSEPLLDGVPQEVIIKTVEDYFQADYWQPIENWDHVNNPCLMVPFHGSSRVVGLSRPDIGSETRHIRVEVSWYNIGTQGNNEMRDKFNILKEFNKELI